ncbi:MAG TPA: Holliday junction resolvase RuvX [Usitatibacter sp.]|nr:Holliday junction resolvase RuvX [Usitatibacter sp.]
MTAASGSGSEARPGSRAAREIRGTLLAFDFGERRIGVAVGETSVAIANPLGAIDASANPERFRAIARLVREWQPAAFVVGRPRHCDGSPHAVARLAEKFARRLAARHALPVALVDETLSSAEAQSRLRGARTRPARAGDEDALAAAVILQAYLDDPQSHERLAS